MGSIDSHSGFENTDVFVLQTLVPSDIRIFNVVQCFYLDNPVTFLLLLLYAQYRIGGCK